MIPCYHGPYLIALAVGSSHNRALYKCPITLLYFYSTGCAFADVTETHGIRKTLGSSERYLVIPNMSRTV